MNRKICFHRLGILLLALWMTLPAFAQTLSAATDGQRPPDANPATQKFVGPLKLFDNLYYIGTSFVSAYLLVTSDGLIMIDTLYQGYTKQALDGMRAAGFDPADIRYVLVTHGHEDHAGGIAEVREVSGATVALSAADWALVELQPDMVVNDGDTLTLGDTMIRFFITPGHTDGVVSMQFELRDGTAKHQAFLFGGHNVTSNDAEDYRKFIASVLRLQADLSGIEVNLTSHPWAALIFQRAELLAHRRPDEAHPFVDGADFSAFMNERLQSAQRQLAEIDRSQ